MTSVMPPFLFVTSIVSTNGGELEYRAILLALLKKKVRGIKASNDYERQGKLVRFAASHGYEIGDILQCMKKMGYDEEYMD